MFAAVRHFLSPVFKQQGSQDVGSVLSFDLVRNDHLLHHLVGNTRQGLLVQVQQHRPCKQTGSSVGTNPVTSALGFSLFP